MSNDDRLARYLHDQAATIPVTPADPRDITRRGARRRNRRRGGLVVSVVAVAAVVAATVGGLGDPDARLESGIASSVAPSTYDWTVLEPEDGLGYSSSATLADGAVYSLSTAPGPVVDDASFARHLYRSDDGAEWVEVGLPEDVVASSIAASGSTLYALGTAPASASGGGRSLVLASSHDGAATWDELPLPDDVAALDERFPGRVSLSPLSLAALDATHQVAAVTVTVRPAIAELVGLDPDGSYTYAPSAEGVDVFTIEPCVGSCDELGTGGPSTTLSPDEAERQAGGAGFEEVLHGTYRWDELDMDPELRDHLAGRTYVFAIRDGAAFALVSLPGGDGGGLAQVVAGPEGYTLFIGAPHWSRPAEQATRVLSSVDGLTWTEAAGSPLPGSITTAGLLGDRSAVATGGIDGPPVIHVSRLDGSWTRLDLAAAVDGEAELGDVAFGPLGVVGTVFAPDRRGGPGARHLVHSADGSELSVLDLDATLDGGSVTGMTVTADAVLVRVNLPDDQDPATAPFQRVLVGTPA